MGLDRTFARSVAVAAVAHVCVVTAVKLVKPERTFPTPERAPSEIAVEDQESLPPPVEPPAPSPPSASPRAVALPASPRAPRSRPSDPPTAAAEPEPDSVPPPVVLPSPSASAWSATILRPEARRDYGSLGVTPAARSVAMAAAAAHGEERPGGESRDALGMKGMLTHHDLELGMGKGGPLIAAIEDVTLSSRVPVEGAASFSIETDASGNVMSVRAFDATSDEGAWQEVAASLLAKMKRRPLHVTPGTRGVSVTLRVSSHVQLPDGTRPKGRLPLAARIALAPLKAIAGAATFDVTELSNKEYRMIEAWETDERPR